MVWTEVRSRTGTDEEGQAAATRLFAFYALYENSNRVNMGN